MDGGKGETPGPGEYDVGGLGYRGRGEAGAGGAATVAPRRCLHVIAGCRVRDICFAFMIVLGRGGGGWGGGGEKLNCCM